MNNIFVQTVAISCCIFTVFTLLKYAYGKFRKGENLQVSKSLVKETEHITPLQKQDVEDLLDIEKVKSAPEDYKKLFFTKLPLKHRTQTYIEKKNYDLIRGILAFVAPGTNISSYINMIVEEHLMKNRNLIKELLENTKIKPL